MNAYASESTPILGPDPADQLFRSGIFSRFLRYKNSFTMGVLFLINLLNYMDRFAIAGVLKTIQDYFNINDNQAGLLQTVFVCSYMALAPIFGYIGDRYSRKWLIIFGVSFWSLTTLAGSFVPKDLFWVFVLLRGLVGIGEASYSCVAPTIIADMYKNDVRTRMLAIFNIAVPLGSGLGYIVGSYVSKAFNDDWRWALRVTPVLGAICILLLIFLVTEPVRGSADGAHMVKRSNYVSDVIHVLKIKSFVFTTMGFTWVAFALGALSWWGPIFLERAHEVSGGPETSSEKDFVALLFGIITCVAGIVGVILGSEVARRYRRINSSGDPIICGVAVLAAIPFLFGVLIFSKDQRIVTWIFIFIAETLMCSNWALISDMLLYIIIPTRRATASAIQIFFMHLFGDASSPYIIGEISNYLKKGEIDTLSEWSALRYALMLAPIVATFGGFAFLFAARFIATDRRRAEAAIANGRASDDFGLRTTGAMYADNDAQE